jgi:uncharacterized membrane protein YccC
MEPLFVPLDTIRVTLINSAMTALVKGIGIVIAVLLLFLLSFIVLNNLDSIMVFAMVLAGLYVIFEGVSRNSAGMVAVGIFLSIPLWIKLLEFSSG